MLFVCLLCFPVDLFVVLPVGGFAVLLIVIVDVMFVVVLFCLVLFDLLLVRVDWFVTPIG